MHVLILALLAVIIAGQAHAQDQSAESVGIGGSDINAGASAGESEPAENQSASISKGISHGVYWWADIDPVAIDALTEFGIDTVAIRLGKIQVKTSEAEGGEPAHAVAWVDGGDMAALSTLPQSVGYRFVIETEPLVWTETGVSVLADWLGATIIPALTSLAVDSRAIEIKMPDLSMGRIEDKSAEIVRFLRGMQASDTPINILIGFDAALLLAMPPPTLDSISGITDGIVVYFLDYDLSGLTPKITDRAWIDATSAELSSRGLPFAAVLPVYNRAIAYYADGSADVIGAVRLDAIAEVSDVRQMGSAGTEYTIKETADVPNDFFKPGDKLRVLTSLNEIDLKDTIAKLPDIAPGLVEIDLFRFPLVPGFDPSPNQALTGAGWLAVAPSETVNPLNPGQAAADQKHNSAQQIIMMITLGLMMFIMMRMFSKTGQKQTGGGGGGAGGK